MQLTLVNAMLNKYEYFRTSSSYLSIDQLEVSRRVSWFIVVKVDTIVTILNRETAMQLVDHEGTRQRSEDYNRGVSALPKPSSESRSQQLTPNTHNHHTRSATSFYVETLLRG